MEAWTPGDLKNLLDDGQSVFLKLWKPGCGICKMSNSATDRMEKANDHQLKFGKISVADHPEMIELAGTDALPVFFVFADKKKKGQHIGFKGLAKLEAFVEESLANE